MIVEEMVEDRIRHYSDRNMKILQVETGIAYDDAVDVIPCRYTYEETDEPIIPDTFRDILVYGVMKDWRGNAGDNQAIFYKRKYNEMYQNMMYTMQLR